VQAVMSLAAQPQSLRWLQRRLGDVFTIKLPALGTVVVVGDPELAREVFRAKPEALHAGSRSPLRAVLGRNSLLAIDEAHHLQQRKLLLPPFHGERMRGYEGIIEEEATREIATWPEGEEFATLPPFSRITLNAIIRAVFGAQDEDADALRRLLPAFVKLGSRVATMPMLQRDLGPWSPWGRFKRYRAGFDAIVDRLIAQAKADPDLENRADVLALLVRAQHEDGSPMSRDEIADQLLTLLSAGHETTASTLAWAVERLRRHPAVLRRLVEEADAGGRELREATIYEVQRVRPTIGGAGRFTMEPFALGDYRLPEGVVILLSALLIQTDPRSYEDPDRFDPDRFVGNKPDTYRWIPFGGGIRRCIGAAFAHMEMDIVLRTLLRHVELRTTVERDERWHFRGVAFAPGKGGRAVVSRRLPRAQDGGDDVDRRGADVVDLAALLDG
jgi:cytochrome P450